MSKWRKERKGINERENEKKNFSLCTDAPLPSEKIWEREKQKQTIYGNLYRNTIKDGDSQTSLSGRFFCSADRTSFHRLEEFMRRYLRYASSGPQARILNPNLIFK